MQTKQTPYHSAAFCQLIKKPPFISSPVILTSFCPKRSPECSMFSDLSMITNFSPSFADCHLITPNSHRTWDWMMAEDDWSMHEPYLPLNLESHMHPLVPLWGF